MSTLLDRIGEDTKGADVKKIEADLDKWSKKNSHAIKMGQAQTGWDKAYNAFEKAIKGGMTPADKKGDANFDVTSAKVKGKEDALYKSVNAMMESYLKSVGYDGSAAGAKEIKDEKEKAEYFVSIVDRITGADASKQYQSGNNPTASQLIGIVKTLADDSDAKVSDVIEAVNDFRLDSALANKAYQRQQGKYLNDRLGSTTSQSLGLNIKKIVDGLAGWKVKKPVELIDPNKPRELYVQWVQALKAGQVNNNLNQALGLEYKPL